MGKRREKLDSRSSQTLSPSPSPSHSSSSASDFEFTISLSPRKSAPADDLFYKGQLLPLHLSPRISMVHTLLLASSDASRDSSSSSTSSSAASSDLLFAAGDSSRPSSGSDDEFRSPLTGGGKKINGKYFSLSRFSSVFKKDSSKPNRDENDANNVAGSSVRRMSATAKEVIRKYMKKMGLFPNGVVFPSGETRSGNGNRNAAVEEKVVVIHRSSSGTVEGSNNNNINETAPVRGFSHSFSGNLRYPRKRSNVVIASSCPSSMRSSPSRSGVRSRSGFACSGSGSSSKNSASLPGGRGGGCGGSYGGDASSMEELQSAIQGAIAHCKNSMTMPPQRGKGILIM